MVQVFFYAPGDPNKENQVRVKVRDGLGRLDPCANVTWANLRYRHLPLQELADKLTHLVESALERLALVRIRKVGPDRTVLDGQSGQNHRYGVWASTDIRRDRVN